MRAQPGEPPVAETSSHPVVWQDSLTRHEALNDGGWRIDRTTPCRYATAVATRPPSLRDNPLLIWGGDFATAAKSFTQSRQEGMTTGYNLDKSNSRLAVCAAMTCQLA